MRIVRTIDELRGGLDPRRREAARIGLVPTMGYFPEGHLALMRRAREQCDIVVVSLFVNPTQFNDPADLEAYPRDETRDSAMAQSAGVELLFAPDAREMYRKYLPLMEVNFVETNPIPVKAAMAEMGLLQPVWRLPLVPPKAENHARIHSVLKAVGLLESAHVAFAD